MCQTSRRRASFNNHLLTKNTTPKKPMTYFLPQNLSFDVTFIWEEGHNQIKKTKIRFFWNERERNGEYQNNSRSFESWNEVKAFELKYHPLYSD